MKNSYAYILAPFLGWLVAQIIKNILKATTKKQDVFVKFFSSGEMPSAHTATVLALTTVIFVYEGISPLFAIAATFSAITIYDALVARRSVGEQGRALVKLLKSSSLSKDPLPRVALGHRPLEVVIGGVIGLIVGLVVASFTII